jgi:hypothetical protein
MKHGGGGGGEPRREVRILLCSDSFAIQGDSYHPVYLMLLVQETRTWGGGGAYCYLFVSRNLAWKCPEHIRLKLTRLYSVLHLK